MNFDFREVLRRSWQITWKHKALWMFGALPTVPILFYLPLIFYFFLSDDIRERIPDHLSDPTFIVISFSVILLTAALSLVLQVFGKSALTFGLIQLEADRDGLAVGEISRGGWLLFWRMLGVMLLASLGTMAVLTVLSACLSLAGIVTFGFGALIGNVLSIPVTLFAYAVMEQSQAAVGADALSPTAAIRRAWELVNEHLNLFAPMTIVLYFGISVLSALATVPVMAPLLLVVLGRFSGEFSNPAVLWIGMTCFTLFLPVYVVFQAVTMLYLRAVHVITYLRLTRSSKLQPLPAIR